MMETPWGRIMETVNIWYKWILLKICLWEDNQTSAQIKKKHLLSHQSFFLKLDRRNPGTVVTESETGGKWLICLVQVDFSGKSLPIEGRPRVHETERKIKKAVCAMSTWGVFSSTPNKKKVVNALKWKGILLIWSTKWSLFINFFAWMGCKSRDESNEPT